jgi:3-hydroxyacyl-[acyl-carrier-protein] dehydratase
MDSRVMSAIPHRPPMLLIDRVVELTADSIVCEKTFRSDEFFFQGHYPGNPICPGVVICESAVQAGAILLSNRSAASGQIPVLTKLDNVRFKRIVRPGEVIESRVHLDEQLANAFYLSAHVVCQRETVARLSFVCTSLASKE